LVQGNDAAWYFLGRNEDYRDIPLSEQHKPETMQRADRDGMNDEIDLLELWHTLLKYKRMILLATFGAAIVAAGYSLLIPNIYRAEVLLAPVSADDAKGGGLASALGGLGGLASLAGISMGGQVSIEENLAVLQSREFLWKFVQEKKLMPILFEDKWDVEAKRWKESDPKKQPGQLDVHRLFTKGGLLSVDKDKKTELVTVAVEWNDAALASDWANALVEDLNLYLAQKTIARSESNLKYLNEELMRAQIEEMRKTLFDLIANEQKQAMLANTQKEFAFKVLDHAVEPDKKIKPKRSQIVILTAFVAGFLAILYAFIMESIAKRREEENSR
jgi:uncharacterized protein involved in exopolysaccharide biosynthesis